MPASAFALSTPRAARESLHQSLARRTGVVALVEAVLDDLAAVACAMAGAFAAGHRAYLFGNGGSASDAAHWAAELSGRFQRERAPLPALALPTSMAELTAIANDYGYTEVFARPLAGLVRPGDVAVGLSTSGRSPNVLRGLATARHHGAVTIAVTGPDPSALVPHCDHFVAVPTVTTAHIQEAHALCGHLLCEWIEETVGTPERTEKAKLPS